MNENDNITLVSNANKTSVIKHKRDEAITPSVKIVL